MFALSRSLRILDFRFLSVYDVVSIFLPLTSLDCSLSVDFGFHHTILLKIRDVASREDEAFVLQVPHWRSGDAVSQRLEAHPGFYSPTRRALLDEPLDLSCPALEQESKLAPASSSTFKPAVSLWNTEGSLHEYRMVGAPGVPSLSSER